MTTDYRAELQRLVKANDDGDVEAFGHAVERARTALSQPEPQGLTDDELEILADDYMFMDGADGTMHLLHIDFAHAAIAADRIRWGRNTTLTETS